MHDIPNTDPKFEPPMGSATMKGCGNCDFSDAVCAAYRHALKDIERGEPENAKQKALTALDNAHVNRMGKAFHTIVKYAVQLAAVPVGSEEFTRIYTHLKAHVNELEEGATVRGWRGDVVKS